MRLCKNCKKFKAYKLTKLGQFGADYCSGSKPTNRPDECGEYEDRAEIVKEAK